MGKKGSDKKESFVDKVSHAVDSLLHPQNESADQEKVNGLLAKVDQDLKSDPDQAVDSFKVKQLTDDEQIVPAPEAVPANKELNKHPKFDKFN